MPKRPQTPETPGDSTKGPQTPKTPGDSTKGPQTPKTPGDSTGGPQTPLASGESTGVETPQIPPPSGDCNSVETTNNYGLTSNVNNQIATGGTNYYNTQNQNINVSGDLHLTTPGGRLVGWPTGSGGGDEDDGRRDAIPDPIIPQELEDVSRKVEKELKDAIESFMSKGHAALAPRGGASQS